MAYMDFASMRQGAQIIEPVMQAAHRHAVQVSTFTHQEWAVVRLAREDGLSSLRQEGRFGRVMRFIFGLRRKNPLSDGKLEALRRMAVLGWHHGYNVAASEIGAFLEAGFSRPQYEVLLDGIAAERVAPRGRFSR